MPALQQIVRTSKNRSRAFHALWTLEGLGALDPALVRQLMKDPNPRMRIQAIRASETLYKAGDRSFDRLRAAATDADIDVVLQAMLTLNCFKVANVADVDPRAMAATRRGACRRSATQMLKPAAAFGRGGRGGPPPFTATSSR